MILDPILIKELVTNYYMLQRTHLSLIIFINSGNVYKNMAKMVRETQN